jgi:hypothetical protein
VNAQSTGEATDTWTVTNKAQREIARVTGATIEAARAAASAIPEVTEWAQRDGGFAVRRLRTSEL